MNVAVMIATLIFIAVTVSIQATELTTVPYNDYLCRPWYNYDPVSGHCSCQKRSGITYLMVKCSPNGAIITPGCCTTFEEERGTFVYECSYFQPNGFNLTLDGYTLPNNVSELNDYMCGPMKRKNRLCSDCIDGFGPSFTSIGFECSNCTGRWYGVPLYLLLELVPITVFYLIVVIFQVSLTFAPMTGYIMYAQNVVYELVYARRPHLLHLVLNQNKTTLIGLKINLALYGIWNLDPIRYLVPPFCVSERLNTTHIALLGYVSAFYPLCLILLTWICTELHGHNFKPVVVLWRPFHRFIVKLRRGHEPSRDLVGVFASFFYLSYSKLVFQLLMFIRCHQLLRKGTQTIESVMITDPTIHCYAPKHLQFAIPAILIMLLCIVLPSILFLLCSIRSFQVCLLRCHLNGRYLAMINIFMEKYNSCCRDGLNGGRDMRIFGGLYFILRALTNIYVFLEELKIPLLFWTYQAFIFSSTALLIAFVKLYKKLHANVFDTLLLSLTALICHLLSKKPGLISPTLMFILTVLPAVVFCSYNILIIMNGFRRQMIGLFKRRCCRRVTRHEVLHGILERDTSECDPLIVPTSSSVEVTTNDDINN